MPITNIDLEHVTEADLLSLIEDRVAEGILYDYKRDPYEQSSAGKRELLKDITSFGNSAGGHIVVGMAEAGGLPEQLVGIDGDLDREKQRLENLCRDCIEPRLVGVRMHAVLLASGRQALIIRVPKSWNPAHAVLFEGRRRYYARNSAGAHEASVEELRAMFTAGATLLDRIREFRLDRINRIRNASAPVALPGGRMILHVVPFSAFGVGAGIDPKQMHGQYLPPLGQGGFSAGYNFEGFLATNVSREDTPLAYTQVFRNGIIESAAGQFFSQRGSERVIWANEVEYQMIGRLKHYLAALAHAAVAPPFAIMLTLEGMEGLSIVGNPLATMPLVPIRDNVLPFPEVVLEDYGTQQDHARALRPVFDALWNAANYPGSQSYDASGNWAPRRE